MAFLLAATATAIELSVVSSPLLYEQKNLIAISDEMEGSNNKRNHCFEIIINQANEALDLPCYSVMGKTTFPPSKNKHDYKSLARYWWPNTKKRGGSPYIRLDGEVNPEIFSDLFDYEKKCKMTDSCKVLSLAFFLTGDEKYAKSAAEKIRVWFLDPATCMNPNLKFAQGIPGKNSGRASGIIESSPFPFLFEAIHFLHGSSHWSAQEQQGLEKWVEDYLEWLLTSPNGIKESVATNNQGSWYDFQVLYFALYTHQHAFAKTYLVDHFYPRIRKQFNLEGAQPLELTRTKSFLYSCYNLRALFCCLNLAESIEDEEWKENSSEKATCRRGLDWLLEFALGKKKWINVDIVPLDKTLLTPHLIMAAKIYQEPAYLDDYDQIMDLDEQACPLQMLYHSMFQ